MFNRYSGGGSMSKTPEITGSKRIEVHAPQVNSSLYELWKPSGTPTMEILFFHGLYTGNLSEPHLSTWESEDGSCNWPQKWLAQDFPGARLLAVSYNACIGKSSVGGSDMYVVGENLLSDMMEQNIGQTPNCPIVLVGHSFGGLVIKEVCLRASSSINLRRFPSDKTKVKTFLNNLKGVFFYGTPHHGILSSEKFAKNMDSLLLDYFKALRKEASRLDFEFEQLCKVNTAWRIDGLGESLRNESGLFAGVVVASEGTARKGDHFNVVETNHLLICKPRDKVDRRFYAFKSLLFNIANAQVVVHQSPGLPKYPIQLETRALELQEKLMNGGVLGVFGMGGVGKTTLAKQVFNSISKDFEYTCFVNDVKLIPLYDLEKQILESFHRNGISNKDETKWSDLKERKTLIVMDDADSHRQLKVLPELQHCGTGSCVIITSRDKDVFTFYEDCIIYEVDFLGKDDARKLLCQYTFGTPDTPEDIPDLLITEVHALVEKCAGLPLTLEVMGRFLREHKTNATIWRETISKLGKAIAIGGGQNDLVWASLKVSYDTLLQDQKTMFIEAALTFFQRPLYLAFGAWTSFTEDVETTWANLVSRSLVKEISSGFSEDDSGSSNGVNRRSNRQVVWVHEHLRDLAKNLHDNISNCHMVSEAEEELANLLVSKLNAKKEQLMTQSLRLVYSTLSPPSRSPLQIDSLAELKELKYVFFRGVNSNGRGDGLTSKLSLLSWEGVCLINCPYHVNNCSCMMRGMPIESTRKLEINLRKLDHLAVLELTDFIVTEEFPKALAYLTNLRVLKIRSLRGFYYLPEDFSNLSRLKRLEVNDLGLLIVPDSFGNLFALEHLEFRNVPHLKLGPESLGNLSSLVTLVMWELKTLVGLPDSFGRHLTSLKDMIIYNCPLLLRLPLCFSKLSRLQSLNIRNCYNLEELGDEFGNLSSLQGLVLENVALQRLPASFGLLNTLEKLHILGAGYLKSLSDNFGQLTSLKDLTIGSSELETLPDSFCLLKSLQKLHILCKKLTMLPDNFGQLTSLKDLTIGFSELETLPDSFCLLKSLQKLHIRCKKLTILPDNFGKLFSLEDLCLDAEVLETLPDSFCLLKSLRKLDMRCERLKRLPGNFGNLSSLQNLALRRCCALESLPESLGLCTSLRVFKLEDCHKLESLPGSLGKHLLPEVPFPRGVTASPSKSGAVNRVLHQGIICNGCRMEYIEGTRFKSTKIHDFDLCSICIEKEDDQADYVRINQPPNPNGLRVFIDDCPFLEELMLIRLGWVKCTVGEIFTRRCYLKTS